MSVSRDEQAVVSDITVAVCGNPNCGKTTIFNALTGLRQKVANYPGVTVEKTTGTFRIPQQPNHQFTLVDIPGTYSLAAFSPDEYVAVRALCGSFVNEEAPDAIIAIVDATNLERSLYFVFQVMQVERPVIVALNMMDLADRRGLNIDADKLAELLGVPVVPMVGSRGVGIDRLKEELSRVTGRAARTELRPYDKLTDAAVAELRAVCNGSLTRRSEFLRVLFDRSGPAEKAFLDGAGADKRPLLDSLRQRLIDQHGSLAAAETAPLTKLAAELCYKTVKRSIGVRTSSSERVDRLLLHPVLGPVVFLALMVLVFQAIFSWAAPFMDLIDGLFGSLAGLVEGAMADGPLRSLLADGVIGGVGSVLIFLPQIIILFIFVSLLEDSGYMPRAAFLVDRLLGWCGLSGKSFIPMLSSFACAIPGIMATRTIEDRRLRFVTIMIAPLMSCSARLPVYTIMIAAFIPHKTYLGIFNSQGLLLTGLYGLGVVLAVLISFVVNRLILKTRRSSFVMEMPSYKVPTVRSVLIRIVNRIRSFLTRAGTVILAITIVIWAASYFPRSASLTEDFVEQREVVEAYHDGRLAELAADAQGIAVARMVESIEDIRVERETALGELATQEAGARLRDSYFGRLGRLVEPVFKPLGWDWKITMAALASFPAREVVIATLGTIYNLGSDSDEESSSLIDKMRSATWETGPRLGERVFTPAVAVSIMVFFALCAQCGATLVTIKGETGKWSMSVLAFAYLTTLAYIGALVSYQVLSKAGY